MASRPMPSENYFDLHVHFGPWRNSDITKYQYSGSFEHYRKFMRESGINKSMVFKVKEGDNLSLLEYVNKRRDLFMFSYWVDVDNIKALDEIDANKEEIDSLKFHPTFERARVTDEKLDKIWKWAENFDKPLLVHCGRWQELSSYKFPVELAKRYSFPVVLLHMGGGADSSVQADALDYISRIKRPSNLFIETSSCFQPWLVERAVSVLGGEKVLFGSDFPSQHPAMAVQCVLKSNLSKKVKEMILGKNALSLFKKSEENASRS